MSDWREVAGVKEVLPEQKMTYELTRTVNIFPSIQIQLIVSGGFQKKKDNRVLENQKTGT